MFFKYQVLGIYDGYWLSYVIYIFIIQLIFMLFAVYANFKLIFVILVKARVSGVLNSWPKACKASFIFLD